MNIEDKIGNLPALQVAMPDEMPEPTTPFRMTYQTSFGDVELVESKDGLEDLSQVNDIVHMIMTEHYLKTLPIKVIGVQRRVLQNENNFRLEIALHQAAQTSFMERLKASINET
jgi:hypothetical protein